MRIDPGTSSARAAAEAAASPSGSSEKPAAGRALGSRQDAEERIGRVAGRDPQERSRHNSLNRRAASPAASATGRRAPAGGRAGLPRSPTGRAPSASPGAWRPRVELPRRNGSWRRIGGLNTPARQHAPPRGNTERGPTGRPAAADHNPIVSQPRRPKESRADCTVGNRGGWQSRDSRQLRKPNVASYNTSDFPRGSRSRGRRSYLMIECNFVKPGKGQALQVQVSAPDPLAVIDRTFKSGDSWKPPTSANQAQYLYRQGDLFVFMDNELRAIRTRDRPGRRCRKYLKESMVCSMLLYNNNPIGVTAESRRARVEYCEPAVRGNTATNVTQARQDGDRRRDHRPQFRETGEMIGSTRTGEYIERVKE